MSTLDPMATVPIIILDGLWQYAARVVRWIDGDTVVVDCLVDVGFDEMVTKRRTIRLVGVDTPELNSSDPDERRRAAAAKVYAQNRAPMGAAITVQVIKYDKYGGRDDGRVLNADGQDVSHLLIDAGMGKPYDGGKR